MKLNRVFELADKELVANLRAAYQRHMEKPQDEEAKKAYVSARDELTALYRLRMEIYDGSFPASPGGLPKAGCSPLVIFAESACETRKDVIYCCEEMRKSNILTFEQVQERTQGAFMAISWMKCHLARLTGFDPSSIK